MYTLQQKIAVIMKVVTVVIHRHPHTHHIHTPTNNTHSLTLIVWYFKPGVSDTWMGRWFSFLSTREVFRSQNDQMLQLLSHLFCFCLFWKLLELQLLTVSTIGCVYLLTSTRVGSIYKYTQCNHTHVITNVSLVSATIIDLWKTVQTIKKCAMLVVQTLMCCLLLMADLAGWSKEGCLTPRLSGGGRPKNRWGKIGW